MKTEKFPLEVLREKRNRNLVIKNEILFMFPTSIPSGGVEESGEPAGRAAEDNTKADHIKGKHTKPEESITDSNFDVSSGSI